MRLATFTPPGQAGARPGIVFGDTIVDTAAAVAAAGKDARLLEPPSVVAMLENLPQWQSFANRELSEDKRYAACRYPMAKVTLHPPVPAPGKFLCVGKNNRLHLDELVRHDLIREIPQEPTGFIKVNACLVGHNSKVARPAGISTFDYEPELAFVIGRHAHGAKGKDALSYVAGVTLFNDLTAREIQKREVAAGTRFWTAKNMPGFGPVGPVLVTLDELGCDPHELTLVCRVNGEERIRYSPREQLFGIPAIVEHFSRYVPFEVGDTVSLGSPAGSAIGQANPDAFFLKPGDTVEVACEQIGTLTTHIIAAS